MKKVISILLMLAMLLPVFVTAACASDTELPPEESDTVAGGVDLDLGVGAAYLMEAKTGAVLYSENETHAASPASVTKIMTLLLAVEALAEGRFALEDTVTISSYAASMGGSQVFLEEGERMSVEDLLKCTVIASANDAAVALAELTAGSESAFVARMNERAAELGLKNTAFENTTGLDDTTTNHYSCAEDIAVMSRELIKHDIILKYSSIWQDTIRGGEFTLTNTNRLVRYYDGCNGLKTGSTDKAGYCVSTTAKRGNMQLIAVIMGAESREARNDAARALLDYGFASYALCEYPASFLENVPVLRGKANILPTYSSGYYTLVDKADKGKIEVIYEIPENVTAPITEGESVGKIKYYLNGALIGECDILAGESIGKIGFFELFLRILKRIALAE